MVKPLTDDVKFFIDSDSWIDSWIDSCSEINSDAHDADFDFDLGDLILDDLRLGESASEPSGSVRHDPAGVCLSQASPPCDTDHDWIRSSQSSGNLLELDSGNDVAGSALENGEMAGKFCINSHSSNDCGFLKCASLEHGPCVDDVVDDSGHAPGFENESQYLACERFFNSDFGLKRNEIRMDESVSNASIPGVEGKNFRAQARGFELQENGKEDSKRGDFFNNVVGSAIDGISGQQLNAGSDEELFNYGMGVQSKSCENLENRELEKSSLRREKNNIEDSISSPENNIFCIGTHEKRQYTMYSKDLEFNSDSNVFHDYNSKDGIGNEGTANKFQNLSSQSILNLDMDLDSGFDFRLIDTLNMNYEYQLLPESSQLSLLSSFSSSTSTSSPSSISVSPPMVSSSSAVGVGASSFVSSSSLVTSAHEAFYSSTIPHLHNANSTPHLISNNNHYNSKNFSLDVNKETTKHTHQLKNQSKNQDLLSDEISRIVENVDTKESYLDMVCDMEDVLLHSNYPHHKTFSQKFNQKSTFASSSSLPSSFSIASPFQLSSLFSSIFSFASPSTSLYPPSSSSTSSLPSSSSSVLATLSSSSLLSSSSSSSSSHLSLVASTSSWMIDYNKISRVDLIGIKQVPGDVSLGDKIFGIKKYTLYVWNFHNENGTQWRVERRYSDFLNLRTQLKAFAKKLSETNSSSESPIKHSDMCPPGPWDKASKENIYFFGNNFKYVIKFRSLIMLECLRCIVEEGEPWISSPPFLSFSSPPDAFLLYSENLRASNLGQDLPEGNTHHSGDYIDIYDDYIDEDDDGNNYNNDDDDDDDDDDDGNNYNIDDDGHINKDDDIETRLKHLGELWKSMKSEAKMYGNPHSNASSLLLDDDYENNSSNNDGGCNDEHENDEILRKFEHFDHDRDDSDVKELEMLQHNNLCFDFVSVTNQNGLRKRNHSNDYDDDNINNNNVRDENDIVADACIMNIHSGSTDYCKDVNQKIRDSTSEDDHAVSNGDENGRANENSNKSKDDDHKDHEGDHVVYPGNNDDNVNISDVEKDKVILKGYGNSIQLIVDIPPSRSLIQHLQSQNYTCAGCYKTLEVSRSTDKVLGFLNLRKKKINCRLCEYSNRVFCESCHCNDKSIIPAWVLQSWDFTPRKVSQMAKAYLDSIYEQPMLCVSAINPYLYSRIPILARVRIIRRNVAVMEPLIICSAKSRLHSSMGFREYLLRNDDFFSLRDFFDLSLGPFACLPEKLARIEEKMRQHITRDCATCKKSGVSCSAGNSCRFPSELIFPFQDNVKICKQCKFKFHHGCFHSFPSCPECAKDA